MYLTKGIVPKFYPICFKPKLKKCLLKIYKLKKRKQIERTKKKKKVTSKSKTSLSNKFKETLAGSDDLKKKKITSKSQTSLFNKKNIWTYLKNL
jgi:hypothetical protein